MLFLEEEERDSVQKKEENLNSRVKYIRKKTNVNKVLKIPERNQNILIKKLKYFTPKRPLKTM